jgi:hypothetical protein
MAIDKELLEILVCPVCKAKVVLKEDGSGLKCVELSISTRHSVSFNIRSVRACGPPAYERARPGGKSSSS